MELTSIIEALLFSSKTALSTKVIANAIREAGKVDGAPEEAVAFAKLKTSEVEEGIQQLIASYAEAERSFTIAERPGGWRLCALPDYAPWVRNLFPEQKPAKLSPPALETLAIIAYRQPVTKASIEAVRGVAVDGVLQKVIDRNLVRIAGRADLPGRPLLYGTTDSFLDHFGIRNLDDLPNSAELRQVQLPEPDLPAAEPATEEQLSMAELAEPGEKSDSEGEDAPKATVDAPTEEAVAVAEVTSASEADEEELTEGASAEPVAEQPDLEQDQPEPADAEDGASEEE